MIIGSINSTSISLLNQTQLKFGRHFNWPISIATTRNGMVLRLMVKKHHDQYCHEYCWIAAIAIKNSKEIFAMIIIIITILLITTVIRKINFMHLDLCTSMVFHQHSQSAKLLLRDIQFTHVQCSEVQLWKWCCQNVVYFKWGQYMRGAPERLTAFGARTFSVLSQQ
jgi:hypothetical protein